MIPSLLSFYCCFVPSFYNSKLAALYIASMSIDKLHTQKIWLLTFFSSSFFLSFHLSFSRYVHSIISEFTGASHSLAPTSCRTFLLLHFFFHFVVLLTRSWYSTTFVFLHFFVDCNCVTMRTTLTDWNRIWLRLASLTVCECVLAPAFLLKYSPKIISVDVQIFAYLFCLLCGKLCVYFLSRMMLMLLLLFGSVNMPSPPSRS